MVNSSKPPLNSAGRVLALIRKNMYEDRTSQRGGNGSGIGGTGINGIGLQGFSRGQISALGSIGLSIASANPIGFALGLANFALANSGEDSVSQQVIDAIGNAFGSGLSIDASGIGIDAAGHGYSPGADSSSANGGDGYGGADGEGD